jgi:predicted MFS family arabinose efflux permease
MAVAVTGILIGISGGSAVGGWAIEAWGAQTAYAVPVAAGGLALALIAVRYRYLERAEHRGSLLQGGTPQSRTTPA